MFAFGKTLFRYLMLLLVWIWMGLQALWNRTGIRALNMYWNDHCCTLTLTANEMYILTIYSLTNMRLEWTDSRCNGRRSVEFSMYIRMPQMSVYRSGYWRCTRCRNLHYDTTSVPEDLICDTCLREQFVAQYKASMESHVRSNGAAEPV